MRRLGGIGTIGCALVTAVAAALAPAAGRAESLLPLQSETAATLGSGHAEAVLGASYFRNQRFPAFTAAGALRSHDLISAPELGLRVAAGSWAEIQASFPIVSIDETTAGGEHRSNTGAGDARLSTKLRLLHETPQRPALGLRFGTKLPNANKENRLGTDETDFALEGLVSKSFGIVSAHVNLGVQIWGNPGPVLGAPDRDGSGQDDLFGYSLALVSQLLGAPGAWQVRLLAEAAGLAGSHFDNDRASVRGGMQLEHSGCKLYAGVSAGLISASENVGAMAGAVYTFELERLLAGRD